MLNDLKYANANIRLLLKYNNWTQGVLCNKTGMSQITLQRRLNSKIPKWTMLEATSIAKAFGLSVEDIFFTRMIPKGNRGDRSNEEAS